VPRTRIDVMIVLALALVGAAVPFADIQAMAIRAPLAVALVAVLPGYAITRAVRLRGAGLPAHLLLSLGMSMAITGLSGFVLNWTPWGLQAHSWAVLLSGITVVAAIIALLRHDARTISPATPRPQRMWRAPQTALLVMALCVVVAAGTVSYLGATHQPRKGFTQLWMVPEQSVGANAFRLGVRSEEMNATRYRLDLSIEGRVVQEFSVPVLQPEKQWQTVVVLPDGAQAVDASLYKVDEPDQVYRHTALVR
jgi:uncharacterized membrane protein